MVTVRAGKPLYVAAGFGGAAALVAKTLGIDDLSWAPDGFPARPQDRRTDDLLRELHRAAENHQWTAEDSGLNDEPLRHLAASYRPGEIASLVVNGLVRLSQ